MTTIAAVAVGSAWITVTADDCTNDAVSEMFHVTVTEAPNMPPRRKDRGRCSLTSRSRS